MSAWIVSRKHIAYLVEAGLQLGGSDLRWDPTDDNTNAGGRLGPGNATDVGQMLWDECITSVCYRYDCHVDAAPGPVDETYKYEHSPSAVMKIDPAQVLKAAHSYRYQSCEHPGWRRSNARRFIEALIDCASHHVAGYDAAEWSL